MSRVLLAALWLLALAGAVVAAGCWDRLELEDEAWVMNLALDMGPQDGLFQVTAQVAIPRSLTTAPAGGGGRGGAGGGGGAPQTFLLASVVAAGLTEALDLMAAFVARQINVTHLKAIFVGEELARSGRLPEALAATRFREFRKTVFLMVTRGQAADVLAANRPPLEINPGRFIEEIVAHGSRAALIRPVLLRDFMAAAASPSEEPFAILAAVNRGEQPQGGQAPSSDGSRVKTPLPRPAGPTAPAQAAGELARSGGNPVDFLGTAVFRGGRMVGTLDGEETRLLTMLHGDLRRAFTAVPDPHREGAHLVVNLRQSRRPAVRATRDGTRVKLQVDVMVDFELLEVQSGADYTSPEGRRAAEGLVRDFLRPRLEGLVKRGQRELRADVFRFGRAVRTTFATFPEWAAFNWPERFPEAEISVDLQVKLRRVGLERRSIIPGGD